MPNKTSGRGVNEAPRRTLPSLSLLSLVIYAGLAAVLAVLLPNQIAAIDPAHKVQSLAAVTSVSFAFTIFAQPIAGALSDRTRGRLGRRTPWILAGAVVGGAFLVGLGGLGSVLWIGVFWVVIQVSLNAADAAAAAVVPDRFPPARRGVASAVIGVGTMAGGALGTIFASRVVGDPAWASACLGAAIVIGAGLYALVTRDATASTATAREPFRWRAFLGGFWVDPRRHPDFARAFGARLVFIFGYTLVSTFQLFVLTDHIGMDLGDANALIGILTALTFTTTLLAVVVCGWWSDRLGRRRVFVVGACVALALALVIPLLSPTPEGMAAFAAIKGLAFGVFLSSGAAMFTEVLPHDGAAAGKDLGILNVATNIPQALSSAAGALVISALGGYAALFVVAIVAVLVAAVLFGRIRGVR